MIKVLLYFVFLTLPSLCLANEPAVQPNLPIELLRIEEAYHIGNQLSESLWVNKIPYSTVPALVYSVEKNTEYLVNHPNPDLTKYELTEYFVNSRPVYKKIGSLTFQFNALLCCQYINGVATILMGKEVDKTEYLITTFLHEGFHYFQSESLYKTKTPISKLQAAIAGGIAEYPKKNFDNESNLIIEGRLLNSILTTNAASDERAIRHLISVEDNRKKAMTEKATLFEDWALLMEGTAYYVESQAAKRLVSNPYHSIIDKNIDPKYSHFQGINLSDLYGLKLLTNKPQTPSGILGTVAYVYGKAFSLVLDKYKSDWQTGLFLPSDSFIQNPESAINGYMANVKANNLSSRLLATLQLNESESKALYDESRNRYLSTDDVTRIKEKLRIEGNIDAYPFEDGWTYKIQTQQFGLFPTFANPHNIESYSDNQATVFFGGYDSIETSDQLLHIDRPTIPVIIYLTSLIRFKDVGHSLEDANIQCTNPLNGRCEHLNLTIQGLSLRASNAFIRHDIAKRETVISF